MRKYQIATLDVWGNEKDGFEVNNVYKTSDSILLKEDFSNKDVMKALKKEGFLKKYCQERWLNFECSDYSFICIESARTGEPLYYLYEVELYSPEIRRILEENNNKFPCFSSVGSYPLNYLTKKEVLCADCANEFDAYYDGDIIAACDINYELPDLYCDNCNERIKSAYAEPEEGAE